MGIPKKHCEHKRPSTACESMKIYAKNNQNSYTQSHKLLKIIENKLEAITVKKNVPVQILNKK